MSDRIKLIKPYISFDEVSVEIQEVFASGQLTRGIHVEKFRQSLRDYTGAKHTFLMTTATTALTMCLKAIDVKPGDKVAVSDFSFPASANVIEDLGAIPVFIDVDRDTYNMSVEDLERKMSPEIRAVMFVDALGNPSGIEKIKAVCERHGVPLIEDAACAIGSQVDGHKVGAIADLTCFSFHPRKLLTTGEGGAILTNNDSYAQWLSVKSNHGASGSKGKGLDFVDYGYNYRMSEIQALMGWKQLAKLNDIIVDRNSIANSFDNELSEYGFKKQNVAKNAVHNVQSLVFEVPRYIQRDALIDYLNEQDVESTIGTYCLSGCTYFRDKYHDVQPIAEFLGDNTITLPCYENVDIERVCENIIVYAKLMQAAAVAQS